LRGAFVTPNTRQREAHGRFAHNLSAACVIGAVSIVFTDNNYGLLHVVALLAVGVICFATGAMYCRGD